MPILHCSGRDRLAAFYTYVFRDGKRHALGFLSQSHISPHLLSPLQGLYNRGKIAPAQRMLLPPRTAPVILPAHISRLWRLACPFKRAIRAVLTTAVQLPSASFPYISRARRAAQYAVCHSIQVLHGLGPHFSWVSFRMPSHLKHLHRWLAAAEAYLSRVFSSIIPSPLQGSLLPPYTGSP